MQIDYYFSPLSPWCYLAGTRLEDLAGRHGAGVRYIPVDPSALFARTGGKMLAERHPSRQDYRLQDLRRTAARENLPLALHPAHFPTNPAPASYAIIAAAKAGGDVGGLVQSFLRACWAEERNIAEDEVIRDLLARHGFDPGLADKGLWTGAEIYERNLEQAVNAGVFGFPFYIVGEEKFWGQDRLADLEQYLSGMK
ncbi:2-hydroxychromene-2-carboxylate isomerase [Falsigemmobacter intermedius]|uniref:2-hydroxychromene-2-carboxylate isomerase n=1 Tax=Falsigemmobacter intermedius TaxID=1553448 RepID=A0A3S3UEE6_9RHOB|nr:2-hydroxychromene-2-carboxylate isomerase [Falsigemmobacter intermedius]RWY39991.1 2-hydroxychromene-2-carboxylate isomerase [Falsigemmobacter intermedius]